MKMHNLLCQWQHGFYVKPTLPLTESLLHLPHILIIDRFLYEHSIIIFQSEDAKQACDTCRSHIVMHMITGDPLHSRALAHSRAPLFTQPCTHCSHSRAPGEQWARLCIFALQGCVQAARLCRGSPVMMSCCNDSVMNYNAHPALRQTFVLMTAEISNGDIMGLMSLPVYHFLELGTSISLKSNMMALV